MTVTEGGNLLKGLTSENVNLGFSPLLLWQEITFLYRAIKMSQNVYLERNYYA